MTSRTFRARTKGQAHGFIRRMVSPGDLGELIKPVVFLDHVEGAGRPGTGFGWHPHSGIATLTYSLNADAAYEDTAGQKGTVEATGLEWMRAGSGTWHQGFIYPREATVTAFQLWVALPPGVEDGPPHGLYVAPNDVPQAGNVRVLLGKYGGHLNPIPVPLPIVYLDVALNRGASRTFTPPPGHSVAWAFVYRDRANLAGAEMSRELAVLDESEAPVTIEAVDD
jgi:redox-sensitive bicupin YhaK (pirin superfamily)